MARQDGRCPDRAARSGRDWGGEARERGGDRRGVAGGQHASEHGHAERAADLLDGGVDAQAHARLSQRQGPHNRPSKAVLYRRWPSRAELVIAAVRQRAPMLSGAAPDTGSVRGDVLALLGRVSCGVVEVGLEPSSA